MSWAPIATGSIDARARGALDAITDGLIAQPPAEDPRLRSSLAAGDLGASLLFGARHQLDPGHGYDELATRRVEAALDHVQADRPWITSGFPGVAFALEHLGFNAEEDASEDADRAIGDLLAAPTPMLGHDWFRGSAGLAIYATERLPREAAAANLAAIVAHLARTAAHDDHGGAWWPSASGARALDPAHGVLGPITALAAACARGIAADAARPLLAQAVEWLWAQRLGPGSDAWFPTVAGQTMPAAAGWCRGDVGIAGTLHAAGRAVDADWTARAVELGLHAARRAPERSGVTDPAICHGAAGLVHVFNRLFQATGDDRFRDAALGWLDRLLAMRCPGEGLGGFLFADLDAPRGPPIADPSLVFGAAGVALVLLAATTELEPAWDRTLMLSVRT